MQLNLLDEYKLHLLAVSKLRHLAPLKLYWDHSFYTTYISKN